MPTMDEYLTRPVADRVARLRSTPDDHALSRRPGDRSWSPKEIVCHLRDVEELFLIRFQTILTVEDPPILTFSATPEALAAWGIGGEVGHPLDPDRWAEERQYSRSDGIEGNVVDDGGSVGFLPPLSAEEAGEYWEGVAAAVEGGSRLLWVARDAFAASIVGTAQLDLEKRANGNHRAEVIKLMVHTSGRRRGVGHALMLAAQAEARRRGRSTLVLDTRQGDPSEALYRSLGWTFAGAIPQYARSANGALHATAIYYLLIGERHDQ